MLRSPRRTLSAVAVLVVLGGGLSGCGGDEATDAAGTDASATAESSESAADGVACDYPESGPAAAEVDAPPESAEQSGEVAATIESSAGAIPLTLDADAAPCTVNSFVSLAEQDYFTDTPCHRLTTEASGISVLQCGDPSGTGAGGPGYSFADELSGDESYGPGTLAMANAGPDTNGSQFFLVYGDSPLPADYTVFGSFSDDGLQVVQDVADAGVQGDVPDGPPAEPVEIAGVTIDG